MKKTVLLLAFLAAIAGVLTLPALADSNTVSVSVTPMVVAVNVSPTSIDYGTLALSAADDSRMTAVSGNVAVKNTGSVAADFKIRGSDATPLNPNDATWTLDCSSSTGLVGLNRYVHRFSTSNPADFVGGGNTLCSDKDTMLSANIPVVGETDVTFQMNMPTDSTGYSARSSTVTVVVSAHQ
ncbi:MAG TPA: hypothetical protein VFY10_09295 [Dehalococcoidia bacterium]|nr:hypothetical protein [Dehalococcoidia bacterium]